MRDSLKDIAYFEQRYVKDVARFEATCIGCKDALRDLARYRNEFKGKINLYYYDVVLKFLMRFYSGYSIGLSKQELGKDLSVLINAIQNSWEGETYDDMESMLCFAIIFDINKDEMKPVLELLIKHDFRDFVLDSMAHYVDSDFTVRTAELKFSVISKDYSDVIKTAKISKENAVSKLAKFLQKKWLSQQTRGILNNQQHLSKDKYRGYWSIESVALVKMLDLDDEILSDCRYYPCDLLH